MKSSAIRAWVIALLIWSTASLVGCEKYALDRKMKELCEKDGGVVVFEVETLPASEFNSDGVPLYRYLLDLRLAGTSQRLGPAYRYLSSFQSIKSGDSMKGEGSLTKHVIEVYRERDGRLLGRSISYDRSGGDLIVLGHPSTASCPNPAPQFLSSVFKRSEL